MIFSSLKFLNHSRGFRKFKISVFNGHINGQNPEKYEIWSVSYVNYMRTHVSTHGVDLETMYGLSTRLLRS